MVFLGLELNEGLFFAHLIILAIGIILLIAGKEKYKSIIAVSFVILNSIITSCLALQAIIPGSIEILINGGVFIGNIPIRIDTLSAWFIIIINLITTFGIIYGIGYMKAYKSQHTMLSIHWIFFILFHSSMLWVCMVQNSIAFLVSWEVMSLSSMFLVLFDHKSSQVIKAGTNYLVQMHLSVVFLTVAFIWVYFKTGTFDFKGIEAYFGANINRWLFLVFFAGFGFKAGFLGMHSWLPYAHPAAPSHVSGIMSGVIVKMGIYGIFRIITYLKADYILLGEIILTISVITGLFGIMNAAVHRDFKRMLAYCTIENIGIIGIGIGIGLLGIGRMNNILILLGFGGALLHVLNHSLFKSLLFFSAGSVYQQTHTRDMDELGGIIKFMPKTAFLFLIGALAIGGIPPFNGFISEFIIYCGLLNGIDSSNIAQITLMVLSIAGLSIIGGISVLTFSKTFGTVFLGSPRRQLKHQVVEVSGVMLVPQYVIIVLMITIAFLPGYFLQFTGKLLANIFPFVYDIDTINQCNYISIMQNISLYSFILILAIGLVLLVKKVFSQKKVIITEPTWGCGYIAPTPRIQYTGKSFSKSLGKLFNFVLIEKKDYTELKAIEIFPEKRKYSSHYLDVFEQKLINPLIQQIHKFIDLFIFIQNGKVQAYVLYGILFIIIVFLGTILNIWQ